jgi:uncharacterized protein YndB with AHSA1/START domain
VTQAAITPVRHCVTVPVPVSQAFSLFTSDFTTWWPGDHIGPAELAEVVLEPRSGGRLFERGVDGSECDWGSVVACDPPALIVVAWHLQADWTYDADPARASEVEVRFTEQDGHTLVELEHRHLERHGERAQQLRDQVGAEGGWAAKLERYAKGAAA